MFQVDTAVQVMLWLSACMALVRNGYWLAAKVTDAVRGNHE